MVDDLEVLAIHISDDRDCIYVTDRDDDGGEKKFYHNEPFHGAACECGACACIKRENARRSKPATWDELFERETAALNGR